MYITFIKDAESTQINKGEARKITYGGACNKLIDATKLLHFCGKRPLFVANDSEFEITLPENPLSFPNLIITGQRKESFETGKIVNEVIKDIVGEKIGIRAGIASLNPKQVMRNFSSVQHLVVVGSESTLQQWAKCLCVKENSRTENSSICIIENGISVFDEKTDKRLYSFDGILDHILCYKINQQLFDNPEQAKKLQPFHKKVNLMMAPQQVLYRINQKD